MKAQNSLLELYKCAVCFEPMHSAVSLDPCGHEFDQNCAIQMISWTKKCPTCRRNIDSFRPAYITRHAVKALLQNVTIKVYLFSDHKYTYQMKRTSKAIDLFHLILVAGSSKSLR